MVTAVITGASSGLGKEYINAVIAQYPSVDVFWLVARRKELLKEIAEDHSGHLSGPCQGGERGDF